MAEPSTATLKARLLPLLQNPLVRQLFLMVGLSASVAFAVAMVLWSQEPEYRTLYANMDAERSAAVVDALEINRIPYRLQSQSGDILVPAEHLHEARLKLAGTGVTRSTGGMAMLEEEKGFGVSEFMQTRKYHHALETELSRTIQSLHAVRGARVHLAIPEQSVFVRNRQQPSASIMLDLLPGAVVNAEQVAAIVNLVASSISNLSAEQVTVVDQQGKLLSDSENDTGLEVSSRQFEYRQHIESAYEKRISALLSPMTGSGRLRVQVAADIDFARVEESRESWNPDSRVVRSEQINKEGADNERVATGVPGALANRPDEAGAGAGAASSQRESITRNYEIERVLNHTENPGGALRRLSVAVVVDRPENEEGAESEVSEATLAMYRALVRDAIGFSDARGDSVTVIAASFRDEMLPVTDEIIPVPFWEQAWFAGLMRQVLTGLALVLLVVMVLRPALRSLFSVPAQEAPEGRNQFGLDPGPQGSHMPPPASPAQLAGYSLDEDMQLIRSAAEDDPKRVAQVVRKWVSQDG